MSDPTPFPSSTPALGLPLLIAGQAQKEFFVNQALCLLDALHMRTVKASQSAPPAIAIESDCFRVKAPAAGAWAGREDQVAVFIAGDWHFIVPAHGMTLYDRAADNMLVFRSGWKLAQAPTLPTGGTIVDTEARAAIGALIQSLKALGILTTTTP